MISIVSVRSMCQWPPYAVGLLGFHLFLLLSVRQIIGALAISTTILGDLVIAGFLLTMAHRAVRGYARHAWLQGYATGHWDGLEDATNDPA